MVFTSIVIYSDPVFRHGGHVHRWAESTKNGFVLHARREAPIRSGELKFGIHGETMRIGPKHWDVHIHSDAPHSLYVLKGTTGPIMANRLWRFRQRTGLQFPRGTFSVVGGAQVGNILALKARGGYLLNVRAGKGFPQRYAVSVSGQDANNFFARAAVSVARTHPSLRGFTPGFDY